MDKPAVNAEDLFARALEFSPGTERERFVAEQCTGDAELRQEVESLLRAHDAAGDFLLPNPGQEEAKQPPPAPAVALQGTAIMNAAAHADAFLRGSATGASGQVDTYVASLPEAVRSEARERIEAGLRVRKLRGQRKPAREEVEETPRLPGFRIERKLGEGGLGVVYAAHDEKLNRRVALKVLRRRADEQIRRRVLDEARKAAALGDPAVVTIFSVLDEADPPAIVMELIEGYPLDRFTAQLSFEQKARLLREVARALSVAHERGLIHRDLKPDNILVGPDFRPRILDFGLALTLDEASRQGGGFEGTPLYASPEQVCGQPLKAASDVFSFGSLMFKVLTGRAPFAGKSISQVLEAIATTAPPFLREVAVGVPEDLQAICLACLAWNPADRPSASELAVELGRFLVGEPVRLKPKLYDDMLRRSISEYATQAQAWESQSIISREEHDAMEIVHRRLLADEDHWIIDARRITVLQTVLSASTWLAVVSSVLIVWMLRDDLGPPWRWLLPTGITLVLLIAGSSARKQHEPLPAATFLAGATLAIAPSILALLAELGWFAARPEGVSQLFSGTFTNQQVLAASLTALVVSVFGLCRLKMTGFAWTTATLATTTYLSVLLLFNWLDQDPQIKALWCLPLVMMEPLALLLEHLGRVRWTLPFHLIALVALVAGLDVIASEGPTLQMLGVDEARWPYFDEQRQKMFSFVLNGAVFLGLMLLTGRAKSLDLRRASKFLEILAILHTLSPLFANAMDHRSDALQHTDLTRHAYACSDVTIYLVAAGLFLVLAPFRSRWRMLVGGLLGCGLGCFLLVDLKLVERKPFVIGLGAIGLLVALGTYIYVRYGSHGSGQARRKPQQPQP